MPFSKNMQPAPGAHCACETEEAAAEANSSVAGVIRTSLAGTGPRGAALLSLENDSARLSLSSDVEDHCDVLGDREVNGDYHSRDAPGENSKPL